MKDTPTIRKADLITAIAEQSNLTRAQATDAASILFSTMHDALANGTRVVITGFGSFEIRTSKERVGVKPGTNDRITIPARKRVAFKPGAALKKTVS